MEAVDRRFATAKIYAVVVQTLAEKVEEAKKKARDIEDNTLEPAHDDGSQKDRKVMQENQIW